MGPVPSESHPVMNLLRPILAAGAALLLTLSPAWAGDADFVLVNKTGYDLREIYISPSKSREWGNDRLGKNILAQGKSRTFRFNDSARCMQDLMVVFDDDGSEVTWERIDLCETHKITLRYNRRSGEVNADIE